MKVPRSRHSHDAVKRLLLIAALLASLSGCYSMPAMTKAEMRQHLSSEEYKDANYLDLMRYLDERAERPILDFYGVTHIQVRENDCTAEFTVGAGPFYGMLELKGVAPRRTRVRVFTWNAGMDKSIRQWRETVLKYPESVSGAENVRRSAHCKEP